MMAFTIVQMLDQDEAEAMDKNMSWSIIARGAVSFPALKAFLRLGVPGGLNMAADGIAFDITTAFAGFLGEPRHSSLDTHQRHVDAFRQTRSKGATQAHHLSWRRGLFAGIT